MMSRIYSYDVVTSTNDVAKQMLSALTNGDVIWTISQTKGRGKGERTWYSPEGGLWFSIVYKPQRIPEDINIYTKMASVSVVKVLKKLKIENVGVKWPNDVYYKRQKLGGILTEIYSHSNTHAVVIGVGVNVNNDVPDDVKDAVSLFQITGIHFSVAQLLKMITGKMNYFYNFVTAGNRNVVTNLWRNSMIVKKGSTVKIHDFSGKYRTAKVVKILSDSLIVEVNGVKERVSPAEISFKNL